MDKPTDQCGFVIHEVNTILAVPPCLGLAARIKTYELLRINWTNHQQRCKELNLPLFIQRVATPTGSVILSAWFAHRYSPVVNSSQHHASTMITPQANVTCQKVMPNVIGIPHMTDTINKVQAAMTISILLLHSV